MLISICEITVHILSFHTVLKVIVIRINDVFRLVLSRFYRYEFFLFDGHLIIIILTKRNIKKINFQHVMICRYNDSQQILSDDLCINIHDILFYHKAQCVKPILTNAEATRAKMAAFVKRHQTRLISIVVHV